MDIVRRRSKEVRLLIIICLCVLSLSGTVYAASSTVAAVQSFHKQKMQYEQQDVHTIRSWMTIPYIALTYHVPSSYLYRELHLQAKQEEHNTLQTIATRHKRSVSDLISSVQQAILAYRKDHPQSQPTPGKSLQVRRVLS